jgi:XTP/dITP diphosphohydrolase
MKTYVATKNLGKLDELRAIFHGSPLKLDTYDGYTDVEEGEADYVENALLKARALQAQLRAAGVVSAAVLADDSGLEVAALGNRPGVLSARYAGDNATWAERRAELLRELEDVPHDQRNARFVCVMALLLPTGEEFVGEGVVDGRITTEERGEHGFGYDPVFFYEPAHETFAELPTQSKNRLSHRARAAESILAAFEER